MKVTVEQVGAEELEAKIQEAKDAGRLILALAPSKLKKLGRLTTDFEVVTYVLVSR